MPKSDSLQGSLDLLVLKILSRRPGLHGYAIMTAIKDWSGDVLRGAIKPSECGAFGKECTPRHPLGATMVSSEGACAAYYRYRLLPAARPSAAQPAH